MTTERVRITLETPDGQQHIIVEDYHDGIEYMWEEGNYACDCNRRLFIARLTDPNFSADDPSLEPCGHTIQLISLERINA